MEKEVYFTPYDEKRADGWNYFVSRAIEMVEDLHEDSTHSLDSSDDGYKDGLDDVREVIIEFLQDLTY